MRIFPRSVLSLVVLLVAASLPSSASAQKSPAIRLDTDLPLAAKSEFPQIAAFGDSVYVTWRDERNGSGGIFFNRSLDGGATWLTSDIRIDSNPTTRGTESPQITASGDFLHVTWQDLRNDVQEIDWHDIYFNRVPTR